MADPRDPTRIVYPAPFLLWTALSIFVLHLGSRRRIRFDLNTQACLKNLNRLAKTNVEGIEHEAQKVNVLECRGPTRDGKEKTFVWWTDFPLSQETVASVGNDAGRLRWKIENEGFNAQKNGGFHLEHMYGRNWNAAKNFYVLLQIGHLIHQLLEKGSLLRKTVGKKVKDAFGSIRAFTRRLLESLRYWLLPEDPWAADSTDRIQIRLDSS
jgi:hypothetical protein